MKRQLILLLSIKAIVLCFIILFYQVGLSPDEAQYWTWSRHLDWGYYSKPPAIAWQIWLSTTLFGNNEFGVRSGAILISFFISLAVYYLARNANLKEKEAFWAGVVMAFSPLGVYLSLTATTDGGAILFFILAVNEVVKGFKGKVNYILVGVYVAISAMYKWVGFSVWSFLIFFSFFETRFRDKKIILGLLISFLGILPSLYWNIFHDWATFKHVFASVDSKAPANGLDFLGVQILLISPIFFLLLCIGCVKVWKNGTKSLLFCASFPMAVIWYIAAAFYSKVQPNWAAYLYPPGMLLIAWVASKRWLNAGLWFSVCSLVVVFSIPWLQSSALVNIPYKINPFRQTVGWHRIDSALIKSGYNPAVDFLMGDRYQAASILSFYGPEQKEAYFFNISNIRRNQFSYWRQMDQYEVGKNGFFVVLENVEEPSIHSYSERYQKKLNPYFSEVLFVGAYPLYEVDERAVKYAIIFRCINYSGKVPPVSYSY